MKLIYIVIYSFWAAHNFYEKFKDWATDLINLENIIAFV